MSKSTGSRIVSAARKARAKKDDARVGVDVKRSPITLSVTCSSCVFYRRFAVFDHPCQDMGVVSSAAPCAKFTSNPEAIASGKRLHDVARAVGLLTKPSALAALSAMVVTARRVERLGFRAGQRVVIRIGGDDYLSNYAQAVVIGAASTQRAVIVAGSEGFTAMLKPESVFNATRWASKRGALIKAKRINDSKGVKRITIKGNDLLTIESMAMASPLKKKRGRPPRKLTGRDLAARAAKTRKREKTITLS